MSSSVRVLRRSERGIRVSRLLLLFTFQDLDNYIIEVQHFEVWDAGATSEENFLGDVYLDLYPRG